MRKLASSAVLFALLGLLVAAATTPAAAGENKSVIKVKGMMCTACEQKVTQALKSVKGVKSVQANYKTGEARLVLTSGTVDPAAIKKAVADAGFQVTDIEKEGSKPAAYRTIKIKGMMCSSCENRVKQALLKVKGVESAEANYKTGEAKVVLASDQTDLKALKEAVRKAGFEPQKIEMHPTNTKKRMGHEKNSSSSMRP